jgi:hypothetical protein
MAFGVPDPILPVEEDEQTPPLQQPAIPPPPPPSPRSPTFEAARALLDGDRQAEQRTLRKAEIDSAPLAPDRAADILRLSHRLGVPAPVVERNYDDMVKRARLTETPYQEIRDTAPALTSWVARDPYHAAIVRDDVEDLTALERIIRIHRNVGGSLVAGVQGFGRGVWGLVQQLGEVSPIVATPFGLVPGAPLAHFAKGAADVAEAMQDQFRGEQVGAGFVEQAMYSGIESIGMAAPSLLVGVAAGPGASLALLGAVTSGEAYAEARQQGVPVDRAVPYAAAQGVIEAVTERIPLTRLLKDVGMKAPIVQTMVHQLFPELVGENIATVLQDLNDWAVLPSNAHKTFSDYIAERPAAAAQTTIATLTMIGIQTGMARSAKTVLDRIAERATESPVAKRSPEKFGELVQHMAEGSPTSTVYAPVEEFTRYFQARGEDPAQKALELTGDATAYETARASGADLAIPIGQYAAQIAPSEHHAFFSQNVRLTPDEPTAVELEGMREQQQQLAASIQDAVSAAAAGTETPEAAGSPMRQAILATLVADAGFHAMVASANADALQVANTYAAGVEQVVTNLAERAGEDPMALLDTYNLQIGPQGTRNGVRAALAAVQGAQATAPPAEPADPTEAAQEATRTAAEGVVLFHRARAAGDAIALPAGFERIAPHLLPEERAGLRRDVMTRVLDVFSDLPGEADYMAAAVAGKAKRGWYQRSGAAIRQLFGDVDAPRFTALLAALSPKTSVEANLYNAVNTWANWVAEGRPTSEAKIRRILDRSVQQSEGKDSVLPSWIPNTVRALATEDATTIQLSGPKVNPFMLNLLGHQQQVTTDAWMTVFAGTMHAVFGRGLSKSAHVAHAAKIRRVADRLTRISGETWTPAEVQETVWSWAKTMYELAEAEGTTAEAILKQGLISDAAITSTPDFAQLITRDAPVRTILEAAGYGPVLSILESDIGSDLDADLDLDAAAAGGDPTPREAVPVTPSLLRSARRLDWVRKAREAVNREPYQNLLAQLREGGGFTYSILEGVAPVKGFALAVYPEAAAVHHINDVTPQALADYVIAHADLLLQEGNHFGAWVDGDQVYLDISRVVTSKKQAQAIGRKHEQIAYFDLFDKNSVTIDYPVGWVHGPTWQGPGGPGAVVNEAGQSIAPEGAPERGPGTEAVQAPDGPGRDAPGTGPGPSATVSSAIEVDDDQGIVLFQDAAAPPTAASWAYSRVIRTVETAKQTRASGRDWKNIIKGSKLGVNEQELLLTDVSALTDTQPYTRDEVLGYLRQHAVPVTWVTLTTDGYTEREVNERADTIHAALVNQKVQELEDRGYGPEAVYVPIQENLDEETGATVYKVDEEEFDTLDEAQEAADRFRDHLEEIMQRDWYIEVRNSVSHAHARTIAEDELQGEREGARVKYADYQLNNGEHADPDTYREVFLTAAGLKQGDVKAAIWRDGHDQYRDIENPIVRLRFNLRRIVETRQPTKAPLTQVQAGLDAAEAERRNLMEGSGRVGVAYDQRRQRQLRDLDNRIAALRTALAGTLPTNVVTERRVLFLEEVQPPGEAEFDNMPQLFQQQWRELAFKWAIRHAADLGVDGVAWTAGQMQRDRYRLSKQLNKISWTAWRTTGTRYVKLYPKRGGQPMYPVYVSADGIITGSDEWQQIEGRKLSDVVGDELARQILTTEEGRIEQEQLDVGGKGLAKLYDVDFPNVVNKLPAVKKSGARVATTQIQVRDEPGVAEVPFLELTPAVREAALAGQTLFQEELPPTPAVEASAKRGAITINRAGIRVEFFAQANLSTFLHETGHLYLHMMGELTDRIRRGDPSTWTDGQKTLVDDFDRILKWMNVATRDQVGTEQHEQFARAFEAYLLRGRAPVPEMAGAFQRFRTWLSKVYESIAALHIDLSPEIVEVFDRLVAGTDAIAAAKKEARLTPIFATPEQAFEIAGIGPIEWQGYLATLRAAHDEAEERITRRLVRELQRERTTWWKARKAEVRTEVEGEIRRRKDYAALLLLQRGELPDGSDAPAPIKIAKASIVEKYGNERLPTHRPYVYSVDDGLDVDEVAHLTGFSSGDELLTVLAATTEKLDTVVTAETDRRMQQQYGDLRIDGTLQAQARVAVQEGAYQEVLTAELRALSAAARRARPIVAATRAQAAAEEGSARRAVRTAIRALVPTAQLNAIATERIGKIAVREIRPLLYWQAAQKAAREASEAMAAGKFEEAVAFKAQQRMAVAMHRAAQAAIEETEALEKYAKRLAQRPAQARLGRAGESYQAQVNALLNKFEFQSVSNKALDRRQTLVEWVAARQREGLPIDVPADVLEAAQRTNYRQVPVERLRELRETLKQIEHLARLKNTLLAQQEQREYETARDGLVQSIVTKNPVQPQPLEFRRAEARRFNVANIFASHTKVAELAQRLDGYVDGGPMWSLVVRPLNEAQDREVDRRRKDGTRYDEILRRHYPGRALARWNQKVFIPAINASLSREAILSVALNWGNETSRDRILSDPKRRWSRPQVEAILDTLDRNDWEFVQETWDFVDSFWQEISDKTYRVTGLRPEKVEAVPVDTKHGRFRGGYYPLAYDRRLAAAPGTNEITSEAKLQLAGAYIRSTTRRGHLKTRLDHVELPVRLELGVLFNHLDQVLHDLTHHEVLIDVSRLLRDDDVSNAIHAVGGDPMYRQFTDALQDIAVGKRPGGSLVDQWAAWAKTGAQISALGLNLWTAIQQPLGLFNGAARVGPSWVMRGMFRWMRDAATMENTVAWIRSVSPFMAHRATTQSQDINDLRNKIQEASWFDKLVRSVSADRVTQQNIVDSFLWHIGLAQRVADVPTWIGQYEKSRAAGKNEDEAIALADQAVRDSQGGGQTVDLSKVQRGGDVARLFMVFYTYGSTVFGQTARAYHQTSFKSPISTARFLGDLSLIYFFPALATIVLSRLLKGSGDEDDDLFELSKDVLAEMGGSALNSMIVLRELGGLLRSSNRGYEGPAGARLLQQVYKLGGQVAQGEVDGGLLKALNQTAGVIFRYPANQMQRSVEGLVALSEDETENPFAVLFGAPPQER